jgi:hypothetical protein
MTDTDRLLDMIEEGVVEHGGDLGGWSRRTEDSLQLFDGRVTLRAEIHDGDPEREGVVHAHVFTTLHEYDDEVLDACLFGMGEDREGALAGAALIWITCVAGPIKSFLDGQPVCMTCQAGVVGGDASQGFVEGDYGLTGLRAFVGPAIARGFDDERIHAAINDRKPWFRFAAESAAPRRVHLAKAMILSNGGEGWSRELEIDGHEVSHRDPNWPAGIAGPKFGYLTRFAVFEFPRNSKEIARRAELERTILHFAQHFSEHEIADGLMDAMVAAGFDADLVHEVESISTIAFGRMFFEQYGVKYASTVIRARRDGKIEIDVPLMSIPAFSRARALGPRLYEMLSSDDFQRLCCYNAESNAILQAMEEGGDQLDLSGLTMYPCVVPDRDVSKQTMDTALATLHALIEKNRQPAKKPWWKFW